MIHSNNQTIDSFYEEVINITNVILEIGYIDTRYRIVFLPNLSIWTEVRLPSLLQYMDDVFVNTNTNHFSAYFTLFDGWREATEPHECPKYMNLPINVLKNDFFIRKSDDKYFGRFIHSNLQNANIFPILNRSIIAFNRHKGDSSVILIPDPEYISSYGHISLTNTIDYRDIPWEKKKPIVVWRGKEHGSAYKAYNNNASYPILSQRRYFFNTFKNHPYVDVKIGPGKATKKFLLSYKYQIDIDGEVNAWSGLWWKLYSNSVVFKVLSHYEQWYYKELIPWKHYIPIQGDFSDFIEKVEWALSHDLACIDIAKNAKNFIKNYTYNRSLSIIQEGV